MRYLLFVYYSVSFNFCVDSPWSMSQAWLSVVDSSVYVEYRYALFCNDVDVKKSDSIYWGVV